jgi:uncharacterized protein involved in exopolysaccharide biosynthesis
MSLPAIVPDHKAAAAAVRPDAPPTLNDLLFVILARRWLVLGIFATVLATTSVLVGYVLSPLYEASSTVLINVGSISTPLIDGMPPSDFEKLSTFQTQKDIISSVDVIAPVVDRLHLAERRKLSRLELFGIWYRDQKRKLGKTFGIERWQKPDDVRGGAIDAVLKNLEVVTKTDSQVLRIVYRARDPAEAQETLQALVNQYTGRFYEAMRGRAGGLEKYLDTQLEITKKQLAASEAALLDFRRRDRIVLDDRPIPRRAREGADNDTSALPNLSASTAHPDHDKQRPDGRTEAPSKQRAADDQGPMQGSAMVGITDNAQIQNELKMYVLSMQDSLRKLVPMYTDSDPEVVELRRRIANYESVLNSLPAREIEYLRLKREYEAVQDTYSVLRKNVERARLFAEAGTDRMQIVVVQDAATAGADPVSPKSKLAIGLAAVFGLVFGVICAFTLDYLDPSIRSIRDAERVTGLRVLGALPPI